MKTNLQRADQVLIPYSQVKVSSRNTEIPLIDSIPVGDYSTLLLSVNPVLLSTAAGAEATSALTVLVRFLEPIDYGNKPNVGTVAGGRSLCVGALDLGGVVHPSYLDVRLPIVSQALSISYWAPTNQTNYNSFFIAASLSTEPTTKYARLGLNGSDLNTLNFYAGDSIFGDNYALNGLNLGAFAAFKFIELGQQTIGKMTIHLEAATTSGATIALNDMVWAIVNKSMDDNSAGFVEQQIWNLAQNQFLQGGSLHAQAQGIPMTGFRQALFLQNTVSGVSRGIQVKWSAFPEFE